MKPEQEEISGQQIVFDLHIEMEDTVGSIPVPMNSEPHAGESTYDAFNVLQVFDAAYLTDKLDTAGRGVSYHTGPSSCACYTPLPTTRHIQSGVPTSGVRLRVTTLLSFRALSVSIRSWV